MYEVLCPWCGVIHVAEHWDDIEDQIEVCWQKVRAEERGTLEAWEDRETRHVMYHAGMGP